MADEHRNTKLVRWLLETAAMVGLALVLALAVRAAVAEAFEVPTTSMEPTIMSNLRV